VQCYDNDLWLTSLIYTGSTVRTPLNYDNDGLLSGINGYTIERYTSHGLPENISDGILVQHPSSAYCRLYILYCVFN